MRAEGRALAEIGEEFGVSRERVRQILAEMDGPSAADARAARVKFREAGERELEANIRRWLEEHGPATPMDVATGIGSTADRVGRRWPRDMTSHRLQPRTAHETWTDIEIFDQIRRAATFEFPVRIAMYEELIRLGEVSGPSTGRITQRFGSWSRACELAGVESAKAPRAEYQSVWTDADLLGFVREYLLDPTSPGTYAGFDHWSRNRADSPSAQTVRNRLGHWTDVKIKALREQL
jgi:hypothetical protein